MPVGVLVSGKLRIDGSIVGDSVEIEVEAVVENKVSIFVEAIDGTSVGSVLGDVTVTGDSEGRAGDG